MPERFKETQPAGDQHAFKIRSYDSSPLDALKDLARHGREHEQMRAHQKEELQKLEDNHKQTSSNREQIGPSSWSVSDQLNNPQLRLLEEDYNRRFAKEDHKSQLAEEALIPAKPKIDISEFKREPVRDTSPNSRGDQSKLQGQTQEDEWRAAFKQLESTASRDAASSSDVSSRVLTQRDGLGSSITDQIQEQATLKRSTKTFRRPKREVTLDFPPEQLQRPEQQERIDPMLASLNDKQITIGEDIKKYEKNITKVEDQLKRAENLVNRKKGKYEKGAGKLDDEIKTLRQSIDTLYEKPTGHESNTREGLVPSDKLIQFSELTKALRGKTQDKYDLDKQYTEDIADLMNQKDSYSEKLKSANHEKSVKEAELWRITGQPYLAPSNMENRQRLETPAINQEPAERSTTPFSDEPLTASIRGIKDLEGPPEPSHTPGSSVWDRIIADRALDKNQEQGSEQVSDWAKRF